MSNSPLIEDTIPGDRVAPRITEAHALMSVLAALDGEPDWLTARRKSAWTRFESLPMPSRRDERWRFSSIDRQMLDGFQLRNGVEPAAAGEIIKRSGLVRSYAGQFVFADSALIQRDPVSAGLADQGVIFKPIAEALQDHGDLLEKYFLHYESSLGSEKFTALHAALVRSGTFLYVPDNTVIEDPIVAYHWLSAAGSAVFPHTLVITGDNARVNFVDAFFSREPDARGFACAVANIHAGRGAKVFRKVVQDWNESSNSVQSDTIIAQRDAQVQSVAVNIGARRARYENRTRIEGPGADVKMFSLTVAEAKQEFDQRTLQIHAAPNAVSDLLYKNALMDTSRTIFSGLIMVEEDAQQTDAYQTNRNLLLDPSAEANSLPGLEILANDVKCSHGATTSKLDAEELFYLRSRGLPEHIAKQLLVFGFFEEIIDKLDNEELAENVRNLVQAKFARHLRA